MSSTRHSSDPSELSQERFASSLEFQGDFLRGNLVAKRVAALSDPERRGLVWFVQDISMRKGFQIHPSCVQFSASLPFHSPESSEFSGLEMLAVEILVRCAVARSNENARRVVEWLQKLCLDPSDAAFHASPLMKIDVLSVLHTIKQDCEIGIRAKVAGTTVSRQIWDALDFAKSCRGLVLVEGTYRVGKSFSSQAWCMCNLGAARYVSLTSARDEESFYRTIAMAVGVAASLTKKASEIRERIELTLQAQNLLLVIDEASHTLPQATRTRYMPQRLSWVITALVNRGVPVALIASRDFSRIMDHLRRTLPIWGQEPFWGRLRRRADLPDALTQDDLLDIARLLAPEADAPTLMLMAGLAMRSSGHAASLESLVTLARYLAAKDGAPLTFESVERAGVELDPTFRPEVHAAIRAAKASPGRRGTSAAKQSRSIRADRPQSVLFRPT